MQMTAPFDYTDKLKLHFSIEPFFEIDFEIALQPAEIDKLPGQSRCRVDAEQSASDAMSGQVRSGPVRSGQVRSGQVRSGQVRPLAAPTMQCNAMQCNAMQ
jgi:hypothetical protein